MQARFVQIPKSVQQAAETLTLDRRGKAERARAGWTKRWAAEWGLLFLGSIEAPIHRAGFACLVVAERCPRVIAQTLANLG